MLKILLIPKNTSKEAFKKNEEMRKKYIISELELIKL